ncbi:prolyl-tRNA editing enzyme YbaK/EbsC (Cys-tRNA(Pro) deacylase) [Isoptericola jiangsuensis]|uniref:Prolyl-tRNA editing enzyme YbaK/EbsC (Cys-tRNA(Pro) deacylase) n=1 Tax=Isoptericola jiangsuensis TaxID=548579 RepID=A0A2A9EVC5_9MICO|nr:YbaK/EbsC family protein [Isoptericola jiangsuensis]PFG42984.1 prolyl-tRNA editing enzyme YbaK/EbsC (Cys-tRNA(Pro) deacylase) [Isoptericola jiangsuensis]
MSGPAATALPTLGDLAWVPAVARPDLLADPVAAALTAWAGVDERVASGVAVAEIDPDHADTATLNTVHGLPPEASANCVVVAGRRGEVERVAACVVPATTSADVNTRVRKLLDVRKASFLPTERATAESAMEYGGITPVGLPAGWRVLVDERFRAPGALALMGSGLRRSKLLMAGPLLCELPGVEVVTDLGVVRG